MLVTAEDHLPDNASVTPTTVSAQPYMTTEAISKPLEALNGVVLQHAGIMDELVHRTCLLELECGDLVREKVRTRDCLEWLNGQNAQTQHDISLAVAATFNSTATRARAPKRRH